MTEISGWTMDFAWKDITELASIILLMSVFCVGLKIGLEDGNWLHPVYRYLEDKIGGYWIYNPLIGCVYCFSSSWGNLVFWGAYLLLPLEIDLWILVKWPVAWLACAWLNLVLYDLVKSIKK